MNREIKAMLILKGIKQADIAKELHVSRAAVSAVVCGKGTSRRIKEHIARRLNKDIDDLWPMAA